MVDPYLPLTGAVTKIRELIDEAFSATSITTTRHASPGTLSTRRAAASGISAPQDLAIMSFLIPHKPEAVIATGQAHLNGLVDLPSSPSISRQYHCSHQRSLLSPVKVRTTLLGGEKKMLVWNDLEADEKIKIYDKGAQVSNGQGLYELM